MYEIVFTHAAQTVMAARGLDRAATEAHIRRDVAECGCEDPMDLFFHTVPLIPTGSLFDEGPSWFVRPSQDRTALVVDVSVDEERQLDKGPFKGMTVTIPKPFED